MKKLLSTLLIAVLAMAASAQCVITLQPGPADGKDAFVHMLDCNTSYAQQGGHCDTTNFFDSQNLSVMAWTWLSNPGVMRSFLEFDLDSLANAGCTVTSAVLELQPTGNPTQYNCGTGTTTHPCNSNDWRVHRVTSAWDDYTLTALNQPAYATSIQGQDFVDIPNQDQEFAPYTIDITDMVNFWLANPAQNFGMAMKMNDEVNYYKAMRCASSDHPDVWRRPKLILATNCNNACDNLLNGNVYDDVNANCNLDAGEKDLENWMVKIEPGPTYATTDANGYYEAFVGTGNFTVTQLMPNNNLWDSICPLPYEYNVTTTGGDTISGLDFALQADAYCPILTVDIGAAFLRKCHTENYIVNYCNNGNVQATGVYIDVEFSPDLTPLTSSIPWQLNGNIYSFWIDTLDAGECGYFNVEVQVGCDVDLGEFECVEAIILPVFDCAANPPADTTVWDRSSVQVTGDCVGDSLACFTILNTGDNGNGNMQGTSEFRIYENNVLVHVGTFQLNGQADTVICWPTNGGNTIRLEADQRPGHPGNSHPNDVIDDCGTLISPMGLVNDLPQDDEDEHIAIECTEVVFSYDPNDKAVIPAGVGPYHYISADDKLEYKIRFQNTGSDTAFTIVIRDTLMTQYLDITSVQSGASSHPYEFRIFGGGILEWTFENILLPDSNVNEPASHGFVKFKVNQQPNNPLGSVIENRVGIIFDFNDPVMTNYAFSTIADMTELLISVSEASVYEALVSIEVYPNPFNDVATINVLGYEAHDPIYLELYDLLGNKVTSLSTNQTMFELHKGDLSSGVYIYRIFAADGSLGSGKVVVK